MSVNLAFMVEESFVFGQHKVVSSFVDVVSSISSFVPFVCVCMCVNGFHKWFTESFYVTFFCFFTYNFHCLSVSATTRTTRRKLCKTQEIKCELSWYEHVIDDGYFLSITIATATSAIPK
jgi:hypothetical protein